MAAIERNLYPENTMRSVDEEKEDRGTLRVRDLRVTFPLPGGGGAAAVDGVSLEIRSGTTLGLVGESGCGKTLTALALLRLLPPAARLRGGTATLDGVDLLSLPERRLRRYRGGRVAMIFQEPMTSLNPVMRVGEQVVEAVRAHRELGSRESRELALEMLARVGIENPRERFYSYPHQLSGGQRQRVMIAMALAGGPGILLADEPTTALDVTVQARILKLIASLRERERMGVLLVTHDLGVVAGQAQSTAVMYLGRLVETARTGDLFAFPRHPYTRALLRSIPRLGAGRRRLETIPGGVPSIAERPSGCPFHPRCPRAAEKCRRAVPELEERARGHWAACFRPLEAKP